LFRKLGFEGAFPVGNIFPVAAWIDERPWPLTPRTAELRFQIEVAAVRAEENVAVERFQDAERTIVVVGDLRIRRVAHEPIARVHVGAADDHDVVGPASLFDLHGPRGAALRVTGCETRDQHRAAQPHLIAIA